MFGVHIFLNGKKVERGGKRKGAYCPPCAPFTNTDAGSGKALPRQEGELFRGLQPLGFRVKDAVQHQGNGPVARDVTSGSKAVLQSENG